MYKSEPLLSLRNPSLTFTDTISDGELNTLCCLIKKIKHKKKGPPKSSPYAEKPT